MSGVKGRALSVESDFGHVVTAAQRWLAQESIWDGQVLDASAHRRIGASAMQASVAPVAVSIPVVSAPAPPRPSAEAHRSNAALHSLHHQYKDCVRCPLGATRLRFVFGVGRPDSGVMFVGEGPGYQEDHQGEPFIGKAGQLLDKMMASIGLSRQTNAYIANIVKCHPMIDPTNPESRGNDRPPTPEEVATCSPILLRQIAVLQPKVIVTLGSPSTKMMLKTAEGISKIRGRLYPFAVDAFYPSNLETEAGTEDSAPPRLDAATRAALSTTQILPTYHPAALLRNPNLKVDAWTDLKLLRDTFLQKR